MAGIYKILQKFGGDVTDDFIKSYNKPVNENNYNSILKAYLDCILKLGLKSDYFIVIEGHTGYNNDIERVFKFPSYRPKVFWKTFILNQKLSRKHINLLLEREDLNVFRGMFGEVISPEDMEYVINFYYNKYKQ